MGLGDDELVLRTEEGLFFKVLLFPEETLFLESLRRELFGRELRQLAWLYGCI